MKKSLIFALLFPLSALADPASNNDWAKNATDFDNRNLWGQVNAQTGGQTETLKSAGGKSESGWTWGASITKRHDSGYTAPVTLLALPADKVDTFNHLFADCDALLKIVVQKNNIAKLAADNGNDAAIRSAHSQDIDSWNAYVVKRDLLSKLLSDGEARGYDVSRYNSQIALLAHDDKLTHEQVLARYNWAMEYVSRVGAINGAAQQ